MNETTNIIFSPAAAAYLSNLIDGASLVLTNADNVATAGIGPLTSPVKGPGFLDMLAVALCVVVLLVPFSYLLVASLDRFTKKR